MELEKSHDQMKKIGESVNELKKSTVDMMDALLKKVILKELDILVP